MKRSCELCKSTATIYCDSDTASLCWTCDAKVHSANFLVARHSRTLLCRICQSPTPWGSSGEKLCRSAAATCRTCAVEGVSGGGNNNGEIGGNAGGDEIDNQVVAWSSTPLPPASSSSGSEEVFAADWGGSLKRKRQKIEDNCHEDEINSSSVNISHHSPSSTVSSSVGSVGDRKKLLRDQNIISGEYMHAPLLHMGKSRRTVEFDLNLSAVE